jgi:hypothetical protein
MLKSSLYDRPAKRDFGPRKRPFHLAAGIKKDILPLAKVR